MLQRPLSGPDRHRPLWFLLWLSGFAGILLIPAQGAASPESLLQEALAQAGDRVIRTAEISFVVSITKSQPSPAEIEARIAIQEAAGREGLNRVRHNPDLVARYEQALKEMRQSVTEQVIANARQEVSGLFVIGGPRIGGDRLVECRFRRGSNQTPEPFIAVVLRRLSETERKCLYFDAGDQTLIASSTAFSIGFDEPHLLGRIQGVATALRPDGTIAVEFEDESASAGDAPVFIHLDELLPEGRRRLARVLIDAAHGYVCPRIEEFHPEGGVSRLWVCEDYFQEPQSGLWFPARIHFEYRPPAVEQPDVVLDYAIHPAATRLNIDLPQERFAIHVPVGTSIALKSAEPSRSWQAVCDLDVTIDDLPTLAENPCLEVVTPVSPTPVENLAHARRRLLPLGLLVVNGLILLALGVWGAKGLLHRKVVPVWLVVAGVASGCSSTTSCGKTAAPAAEAPLSVSPAIIEFGAVAGDGQLLRSALTLVNRQPAGSLKISVRAGCGCTSLSDADKEFVLDPGERHVIPLTMATSGREGAFTTEVTAQWRLVDDAAQIGSISVPISARVLHTIFAQPSRVLVSPSDSEQLTGLVSISAQREHWPDLEIVGGSHGITVIPQGDARWLGSQEQRLYRVEVASRHNVPGASVIVRKRNQVSPVLTIPILATTRAGLLSGT